MENNEKNEGKGEEKQVAPNPEGTDKIPAKKTKRRGRPTKVEVEARKLAASKNATLYEWGWKTGQKVIHSPIRKRKGNEEEANESKEEKEGGELPENMNEDSEVIEERDEQEKEGGTSNVQKELEVDEQGGAGLQVEEASTNLTGNPLPTEEQIQMFLTRQREKVENKEAGKIDSKTINENEEQQLSQEAPATEGTKKKEHVTANHLSKKLWEEVDRRIARQVNEAKNTQLEEMVRTVKYLIDDNRLLSDGQGILKKEMEIWRKEQQNILVNLKTYSEKTGSCVACEACKAAKQEVREAKKQQENLELKVQQLQKEKNVLEGQVEKMREVLRIDSNRIENEIKETRQTKQQNGQQRDIEDNNNGGAKHKETLNINKNQSHNLKAAINQNVAAKGNDRTSNSTEEGITKPRRLSNEEISQEMKLRASRKRDIVIKNLNKPVKELEDMILRRTTKKPVV